MTAEMEAAFVELQDAVETCLQALDHAQAHAKFRAAVETHPGGQAGWARAHGFSPAFVNDVLHGRRDVSEQLAAALGLERRTVFVRAGNTNTQETWVYDTLIISRKGSEKLRIELEPTMGKHVLTISGAEGNRMNVALDRREIREIVEFLIQLPRSSGPIETNGLTFSTRPHGD